MFHEMMVVKCCYFTVDLQMCVKIKCNVQEFRNMDYPCT